MLTRRYFKRDRRGKDMRQKEKKEADRQGR